MRGALHGPTAMPPLCAAPRTCAVPLPCALLLCTALSGCAGLLQSRTHPEQIYYLRAPAAIDSPAAAGAPATAVVPAAAGAPAADTAGTAPLNVSLRVGHPLASPGLDSPHIMLLQSDHRMNFYAGSRWPSAAADVIETLAAQTLRASGAWASVEDTASPFPSDYLLQLAVRHFEADYTAGGAAPVVRVVIDCIIGRGEGREVVATFTASGSVPAAANRLSDVVAAFEQATSTALAELAQQAAQAARADRLHPQNDESPVPSRKRPSQ